MHSSTCRLTYALTCTPLHSLAHSLTHTHTQTHVLCEPIKSTAAPQNKLYTLKPVDRNQFVATPNPDHQVPPALNPVKPLAPSSSSPRDLRSAVRNLNFDLSTWRRADIRPHSEPVTTELVGGTLEKLQLQLQFRHFPL